MYGGIKLITINRSLDLHRQSACRKHILAIPAMLRNAPLSHRSKTVWIPWDAHLNCECTHIACRRRRGEASVKLTGARWPPQLLAQCRIARLMASVAKRKDADAKYGVARVNKGYKGRKG